MAKAKKNSYFWEIICILIGLAVWVVTFVVSLDFIKADVRFSTEATLTDVRTDVKTKLLNKDDAQYSPTNKYQTYYVYVLTWTFKNANSGKEYSYVRERESSTKLSFENGQKDRILVYYNGKEEDFEIADPMGAIILILIGTVFIIGGAADIVGRRLYQKRKSKNSGKKTSFASDGKNKTAGKVESK